MPILALAYLAYVGLGLPDPLPGTVWPEVAPAYGLPNAALGMLLIGGSLGYILAGLLAGRVIGWGGIGLVVAASLAMSGTAALGQGLAPPWAVFVALAVLAGLGSGAVDAGLNAFAAARFAPRHLNWLHGCWGIGATLGPAIAAGLLAAGLGWQAGYLTVAALLILLAGGFLATRHRWDAGAPEAAARISALAVLRNPVARLQLVVFFLYTGFEASAGQWAPTVLAARGAGPAEAALGATIFWGSLAGARILLGFVVDRVGADRLLRLLAPLAVLGALGFAAGVADSAMLVLLAFALAPVYPTLMARTPARLGAAAAVHAVGFQVSAAMAGVMVIPGALGVAADLFGAQAIPWLVAGGVAVLAVLLWRLTLAQGPGHSGS